MGSSNRFCRSLLLGAILFFSLSFVNAESIDLYEGPITQSLVNLEVFISDSGMIKLDSEFSFENPSSSFTNVSFVFSEFSNEKLIYTFSPGEARKFNFSKSFNYSSENSFLDINPEVLIEGKNFDYPVRNFILTYRFESLNQEIISSSVKLYEPNNDNLNEKLYRFEKSSYYPSTLNLRWSKFNPKISVVRSSSQISKEGDVLTIEVSIKNEENYELKDLILKDAFLASNYLPPPSDNFEYFDSSFEPSYIYNYKISNIAPQETILLSYKLLVTNLINLRLLPIEIYSGERLIASLDGEYLNVVPTEDQREIDYKNANNTFTDEIPVFVNPSGYEYPQEIKTFQQSKNSKNWIIILVIALLAILIISYYLIKIRARYLFKTKNMLNNIQNRGVINVR